MPCINNTNGQAVPGVKGSCPTNSHWSDFYMSEEDLANMQKWEGGTDFFGGETLGVQSSVPESWLAALPLKAIAGTTALSAPLWKPTLNYLKNPANLGGLKGLGKNLPKNMKDLMGHLFYRRSITHPINPNRKKFAWDFYNKAGKFSLQGVDKLKALGWAGLTSLMWPDGDDEDKKEKPLYPGGFMNTAQQYQQTAGQQAPPPEPTNMEKFGKNIKDPKWWMESMSGDKTDTRLMRLGQLMDYYGKTPKGRQASDMPSKLWAANAAAAAKGATSSYTALKNMILSPSEITKQIFIDGGGIFGTSWGGMSDDEKKAAAQQRGNAINALMHELAMMGQLPTMANAQALYKIKNPDTEPPKPETDEDDKWYKFFS